MAEALYLGIDGGGTRTTALLADSNGLEIARAVGESINFYSVGFPAARAALQDVVSRAVAGHEKQLRAAFIGHSALDGRADPALTNEFCGGIFPCPVTMDSDVYIALRAMQISGPAAVAIAGTGSMAAGRAETGEILHTGGWGWLLGDEGSGYALSVAALRAAIRGWEGAADPTSLTDSALRHFSAETPSDLIRLFYDPPMPRSRVASFAPCVFGCGATGDQIAVALIREQARAFADTVCALLSHLPKGTPIGLWGGLFRGQPVYRAMFSVFVNNRYPKTKIGLLPAPPEYGALLAAMDTEVKA